MSQNLFRACSALLVFTALVVVAGLSSGPPLAALETEAGRELFTAQKCTTCHSVSSLEIASTAKSDKIKVTDLSDVGLRRDAAALRALLEQKEMLENGKKHPKKVDKMSAEELTALIDWLAGLKKAS